MSGVSIHPCLVEADLDFSASSSLWYGPEELMKQLLEAIFLFLCGVLSRRSMAASGSPVMQITKLSLLSEM